MNAQINILEEIARRHLGLETLQTRHSDRLDFHVFATGNCTRHFQSLSLSPVCFTCV